MATPTYELIESIVLTSTSSSVNFTSIPQSFRDLVLVEDVLGSGGNVSTRHRFNGEGEVDRFDFVNMRGDGSSATSASSTGFNAWFGAGASTTVRGNNITQILDYSATDKHKSILSANVDNLNGRVTRQAIRYKQTTAISAIEIFDLTNSYAIGSSFHLYGIASEVV